MTVDYNAWLANPDNNANRNLLVDVSPYSGASVVTRKLSYQRCPAAGPYMPVIRSIPAVVLEMQTPWGGDSFRTIGDIEFDNADGLFDGWLFDAWAKRDIVLRFGDRSWQRDDYEVIYTGKVSRIRIANADGIVLELTDLHAKFDEPIQLNTVDDGTNGEVEIPLCYGYCYQVRPILVDTAAHKYQVHDGAVEDCMDGGAIYIDGDQNALSYTEDNANGIIDLSADPGGVLTLNTKGAKVSGTWLTKPGEIFRQIATSQAGVSDPSEIDTTAFSAFDTGKPVIGLFIDKPMKVRQALEAIAHSFCAYYTVTRDGKLTIGHLVAPTSGASTMDVYMSRQHIAEQLVVYPQDEAPRYKTRLGYARAWTINTSTNPNINPPHREWFRRGFKVAEHEDVDAGDLQTAYLDATVPEVDETLIAYESDAETWAEHRQDLYGGQRYYCEAVLTFNLQLTIGTVITIHDDKFNRYGFGSGRPVTVVGIEDRLNEGAMKITGWF